MIDKRRYPRLNVNLPVTLRCNGRLLPATALNISCGGMRIRADGVDIHDNDNVEVIFDLSSAQRDLSMRGTITRVNSSEESSDIGVQFNNLFSLSHKAIEEFIGMDVN